MIDASVRPGVHQEAAAHVTLLPFEHLYTSHVASVHRFCLSQVGDAAAAEDITHDTFIRAFAAYQRVRPAEDVARTWLISIARNLSTDHHRRHGRWRRLIERQRRVVTEQRGVESLAEERSQLHAVAAAMVGMRPRERELIGLRVAADLSYREVGELMGMSEPAAKVATHRALGRLRERLGRASVHDIREIVQ
ncbi:MAG TPA: sigma-70 family RNA polymerase sigma factor [Candidatus Dormibacteraeota bacterium]|jgi:RNA polymerase sigma-70 factor (ECF subfamily)